MSNQENGKIAERAFENYFLRLGKNAHVHRFEDMYDAKKISKTAVAGAQPADYLVTCKGVMFYAEVKYVSDPDKFSLSIFKVNQQNTATMVVAAGGKYFGFIYRAAKLMWYKIPLEVLQNSKGKTFYFDDLYDYIWS